MAYFRRRYRRRYRPRRYVRRWFKRRFRRYVNGSSRSTVRMKTAVEAVYTATVPDAATLSSVMAINTFSGARSVLKSPLYLTYCSLYEECKCIGMKVSLSVSSQIGGTSLPSLQIYTAWDRRHGSSEPIYGAADIKNSSTYNVATALNNNVAKLTRSLYASDLMEKAQWHDCSVSDNGGTMQDDAYQAAGVNPNFFCPCFYATFGSPNLSAAQSPATVSMSISTVYYMAFRNPKYGAGASNSKLADLGRVNGDAPRPDDDGDMDIVVPVRAPVVAADMDDDDDLDQDIIDAQAARASAASARERPQRQSVRAMRSGDPVSEDERRAIGIRNAQRQADVSANRSRAVDGGGDLNE